MKHLIYIFINWLSTEIYKSDLRKLIRIVKRWNKLQNDTTEIWKDDQGVHYIVEATKVKPYEDLFETLYNNTFEVLEWSVSDIDFFNDHLRSKSTKIL